VSQAPLEGSQQSTDDDPLRNQVLQVGELYMVGVVVDCSGNEHFDDVSNEPQLSCRLMKSNPPNQGLLKSLVEWALLRL
jgi:hypothetical protein